MALIDNFVFPVFRAQKNRTDIYLIHKQLTTTSIRLSRSPAPESACDHKGHLQNENDTYRLPPPFGSTDR